MDPTISREHARLVLDQSGWHIINLTAQNVVRINGRLVPGGSSLQIQPQDILVLGNTMLQLIAPSAVQSAVSGSDATSYLDEKTEVLPKTHVSQPTPFNSMIIEKGRSPLPSSLTPPVPLQQHPTTARMQEPASSSLQDGAGALTLNVQGLLRRQISHWWDRSIPSKSRNYGKMTKAKVYLARVSPCSLPYRSVWV